MPLRASQTVEQHLKQGHVALRSGAWREARRAFEAALANGESAEALEGLGAAAWWLDDGETTLQARERAYQLYRRRADHAAAARVAAELAEDYVYFRSEPAVAHGWLKRARRLLEGLPLVAEHGWLEVFEADLAIFVDNDPALGLRHATLAHDVGRKLGLIDVEILALAVQGLALVSQGKVAEGMLRLDEAAVAAMSGEMSDLLAIGFACCYLMTACERARDFDRAAQWCKRVDTFCQRTKFGTLYSICRIQYASILMWRGEWQVAEGELQSALRNLAPKHRGHGLEAVVRLAELRRRQGRGREALGLLKQAADHPRALLERAALALDGDDTDTAAQLVQRFLRKVTADNSVDRLPALELLVRAEVSRGNGKAAGCALADVQAAAAQVTAPALRAGARMAEGLVAAHEAEYERACHAFEDAVDLFARSGAEFEKARARLELARAQLQLGREVEARAEAEAALETFSRLGAEPERRSAEDLLRAVRSRPQPPGLTNREVEVLHLLALGLSNPKIAMELRVSEFTIKRHVSNILTKLNLPSRAAAAAYAARQEV